MKLKTLIPALLCATGIASAKSPVETYGSLSVKNNKMVDETGSPVTLRGMSLFWHMDFGGKEYWNNSVVTYLQVNWRNSVIRAPVGVHDGKTGNKGYISAPQDAMIKIHDVVDAAITAGSYVIVDWHAHKEARNEAVTFFGTLAKEYGNTPNILWEIWNEPAEGGTISEGYITAVASEIRKYSENIIIIGSNDWSANPQNTYGSVDSKFKNLMYAIHFYNDHDWVSSRINQALAANHAVFATEWGLSKSDGKDPIAGISGGNIGNAISAMNTNGVSHCNWDIGSQNDQGNTSYPSDAAAALNQKVTTTPKLDGVGWADADLTTSGKTMKAYLISKNPEWTLSDTTTRVLKPLTITSAKKADLVLGSDTVEFGATFSKSAAYSLALTAPSGAKKTYSGQTVNLLVRHPVHVKNLGTTKDWAKGETVTATLTPGGSKVTFTLSTTSNNSVKLTRVHETTVQWERTRIFLPDGLISAAAPVRVMIRNAQGQVVWQKSATMGAYRSIEMGESAPRLSGVNFLEIHSSESIVRSSLAPTF
ncbi:MAG TPA: glycoside hydrolase family 5 protein [Fibrobacteria bacterium]|nr:glycoside hydrolase family 5 protein [Fibrobacteria bacterium]HOX51048.1 glycoside hydrolase family 5 protein [Fibrobacteria bacterium]